MRCVVPPSTMTRPTAPLCASSASSPTSRDGMPKHCRCYAVYAMARRIIPISVPCYARSGGSKKRKQHTGKLSHSIPASPRPTTISAISYITRRGIPAPRQHFTRRLHSARTMLEAWNGLGHSLQQQGQLREAVEAFRRAAQCAPSSAEAHANLGTSLIALEHNTEAQAALRRALTLNPAHAPAQGNLGALLARAGYPVAAESACRSAIALAPGEHRWLTNLGVALLAQGRHDRGRGVLSPGTDAAARLRHRTRQPAVRAQLSCRHLARGDLRGVSGLEPASRKASRIGSSAI